VFLWSPSNFTFLLGCNRGPTELDKKGTEVPLPGGKHPSKDGSGHQQFGHWGANLDE